MHTDLLTSWCKMKKRDWAETTETTRTNTKQIMNIPFNLQRGIHFPIPSALNQLLGISAHIQWRWQANVQYQHKQHLRKIVTTTTLIMKQS
jgi:hypothetical protein